MATLVSVRESGRETVPELVEVFFHGKVLSPDLCAEARVILEDLAQRDHLRAVVLRCALEAGEPASWPSPPDADSAGDLLPIRDLVEAVAGLPMPSLAVLHGPVTGEGLELALATDLRLASSAASFAMPQLGQQRLPFCGGTQRLPRLVGVSAAFELFLGPGWDAARGLALGLVNGLAPVDQLEAETNRWVEDLTTKAPLATRYLKESVQRGMDLSLEQGLLIEEDLYLLLQTTEDRKEGIRAFLDKRRPRFTGR